MSSWLCVLKMGHNRLIREGGQNDKGAAIGRLACTPVHYPAGDDLVGAKPTLRTSVESSRGNFCLP